MCSLLLKHFDLASYVLKTFKRTDILEQVPFYKILVRSLDSLYKLAENLPLLSKAFMTTSNFLKKAASYSGL